MRLKIRRCTLVRSALLAIVLVPKMDGQLLLRVQKVAADRTHVIVGGPPGARYVGLLTNKGTSAAFVEIIQMRGRGNGNGRFRACYLERWNSASNRWDYLEPPIAVAENVQASSVILRPNTSSPVCSSMISAQPRGQHAECYRFTLQVQTRGSNTPTTLSRAFRIGVPVKQALPSVCPEVK